MDTIPARDAEALANALDRGSDIIADVDIKNVASTQWHYLA